MTWRNKTPTKRSLFQWLVWEKRAEKESETRVSLPVKIGVEFS